MVGRSSNEVKALTASILSSLVQHLKKPTDAVHVHYVYVYRPTPNSFVMRGFFTCFAVAEIDLLQMQQEFGKCS